MNTNDSNAGSLRQAIIDAAPGDTINFSVNGVITLTTGELSIDKGLTITGPGAELLTISGNNSSRIFNVASGVTASLSGLTISYGKEAIEGGGIHNSGTLSIDHCSISFNETTGLSTVEEYEFQDPEGNIVIDRNINTISSGGGIYNSGMLSIANSSISNNSTSELTTIEGIVNVQGVSTVSYGGGIYNSGTLSISNSSISDNSINQATMIEGLNAYKIGYGGGIYNTGTLSITSAIISNNIFNTVGENSYTDEQGGGIYSSYASLTIADSTFNANSARYGGGIINDHGQGVLTITNSTFSGNSAYYGGGVLNRWSELTISGSTFSGNSADHGGGIGNHQGTQLNITDSLFSGNSATGEGGGIRNFLGNLTITGSAFSSNSGDYGGGVYTSNHLNIFLIQDSTFNGNSATYGGSVYNHPDTVYISNTIADSTFSDNSATYGGVIYNLGNILVQNATISNNSANDGGGIYNLHNFTLEDSTLSGNHAVNDGGAIYNSVNFTLKGSTLSGNHADNDGGGIRNLDSLSVTNSSFSGNSAVRGGAVSSNIASLYNGAGFYNSTISGNSAAYGGGIWREDGSLSIRDSIISDNVATVDGADCSGSIISLDNNLIENIASCEISGASLHNIYGQDPMLGPLQDNGGPTFTMALPVDSPAIDKGGNNCVSLDQRGIPRPQHGKCDIGAYEKEGFVLTVNKNGTGIAGVVTSNIGAVNCGSICLDSYFYNTSVTLTATTTPAAVFAGWSGGVCSGTGSCVVTMDAAKTVTATFNYVNATPTAISVTPSVLVSAPNVRQTFTAVYRDYNGYSDLKLVYLRVHSNVNGIQVYYDRLNNRLYMIADSGNGNVGWCTPGVPGTLQNTQGALDCALTTIIGTGDTLTVNLAITPKPAFESAVSKNLYLLAKDMSNMSTAWTDKGDWTVFINQAPTLGSVTPPAMSSAAGLPMLFSAVYSDPNGYIDIKYAYFRVTSNIGGIQAYYYNKTGKLTLLNDAGSSAGSCLPGQAATIENSQGILNCATTSVTGSGNDLTIKWSITPKAAFQSATPRSLYAKIIDNTGLYAGFTAKGSWLIKPAPTPDANESYVPGGCFLMGDTFGDGLADELPVHTVCIDSIYMDKFEVTQGEYFTIMGTSPSSFSACGSTCPVETVSWQNAADYCAALGKELPTEAEWEYAARGGAVGRKWAGTSSVGVLGDYAWYDANASSAPHAVGQKLVNDFGLYDMSGNVMEWVAGWYDENYYSVSPLYNPIGPATGTFIMARGGSWFDTDLNLRASSRAWLGLTDTSGTLGFRCMRLP